MSKTRKDDYDPDVMMKIYIVFLASPFYSGFENLRHKGSKKIRIGSLIKLIKLTNEIVQKFEVRLANF